MTEAAQEFKEKVERIMKSKSLSVAKACKELGEDPGRYYSISYSQKKKSKVKAKRKYSTKSVRTMDIPEIELKSPKLVMIVGTSTELSILMKGIL